MKPKVKKIFIGVTAVVIAAATGLGIWFAVQGSGEPVPVFPFQYIGMTEFWGDTQESYGPVSTDRIQTVYLSDTQTVTEIKVAEGDTVKKGDLLMTFDTTLSDLALERKRLDVEKLKLQLQKAEARLQEIKVMKPMVIPSYSGSDDSDEDTDTGKKLEGSYKISHNPNYDGSEKNLALICWIKAAEYIDAAILEELRETAKSYYNYNNGIDPPVSGDPAEGEAQPKPFGNEFYAVIKVTEGNTELGRRLVWQGIHVIGSNDQGFKFRLFDAYGVVDDHMLSEEDMDSADTSIPEIDYGSGYTSAQIAEMRREQEKKIKTLKFDIKMAETNYKIAQTEVADGNVYSQIDGQVVSVLTEEDARGQSQPILKISGGGGFFIEGTINELEKSKLQIGQEVTVNDWNTGTMYTGEVTAVGDFPSTESGWNGMGNPNASYYPFTVFVGEEADLQAGTYASIQFSTGGTEHGVYLENPFIRSEQGNFYVFVRNREGKLEKRYIVVGKSLWGNYKEILSGIDEDDLIAFPYGKYVKEGADTVESDLSVLYQ